MKKITVLYDSKCGFCLNCARWLIAQPAYFKIECLSKNSVFATRLFPGLKPGYDVDDLTVIDDDGGVYRGARAWIICLYALVEYRELSGALASPAMLPFASRVFKFISENRRSIPKWFFLMEEDPIIEGAREYQPVCTLERAPTKKP